MLGGVGIHAIISGWLTPAPVIHTAEYLINYLTIIKIMKEREKLIEQQSVMAPDAFEEKVKDFEKKVQNSQINRQESVRKLELMVQQARSTILDELKPILVEHSKEKGITVILEKNTVILSSDEMDITSAVMKKLDKQISKIDVKYND